MALASTVQEQWLHEQRCSFITVFSTSRRPELQATLSFEGNQQNVALFDRQTHRQMVALAWHQALGTTISSGE
jgi:hypothetical protein